MNYSCFFHQMCNTTSVDGIPTSQYILINSKDLIISYFILFRILAELKDPKNLSFNLSNFTLAIQCFNLSTHIKPIERPRNEPLTCRSLSTHCRKPVPSRSTMNIRLRPCRRRRCTQPYTFTRTLRLPSLSRILI